MNIQTMQVSKH